jgi:hypothetical protein
MNIYNNCWQEQLQVSNEPKSDFQNRITENLNNLIDLRLRGKKDCYQAHVVIQSTGPGAKGQDLKLHSTT